MADRTDDTRSASEIGGELMTTRYVGIGGNDGNTGLSWAQRKLTLNGVEDTPIQAGDTVYVGPGTYRNSGTNPILTCDVDGTAGAGVITYIGDYDGSHTDGTGGVVRLTSSADDLEFSATNILIDGNEKSYRTFKGFFMEEAGTGGLIFIENTNWIIEQCLLYKAGGNPCVYGYGANQSNITVRNCYFRGTDGIKFYHTSPVDNAGHVVENCIFSLRYASGIESDDIGGITIRNCTFEHCQRGVNVSDVPNAGQTIIVNNCLFQDNYIGCYEASNGYLIEDYNAFSNNQLNRTNTSVGAHSNTYIRLIDNRWFFEMVAGGSILSQYDLASYSMLINVAGTSPTTADMRGTTVQGTQREWGALEYDSTLDIEAGTGAAGGLITHPGMSGGMNG